MVMLFHYRQFEHPDWIDEFGRFAFTGVDLFFVRAFTVGIAGAAGWDAVVGLEKRRGEAGRVNDKGHARAESRPPRTACGRCRVVDKRVQRR